MPDDLAVTNFHVQFNGTAAAAEFMRDVYRITVETSVHLPSVATIVVYDPELKWVDDSNVWPGIKLKVQHSTGQGAETLLFDGEIVEVEPHFDTDGQWLTIRAFDGLHRLSRGRYTRTFQNIKDSDLATEVTSGIGLTADATETAVIYDHVWQANETNLEFLRRRAAMNGYLVYAEGMKVHFNPPPSGGGEVSATWGENLIEFHPCLSTVGQINETVVRGWDVKTKAAIVGQASAAHGQPQVGASESGGAVAQQAYGAEAKDLISVQPVPSQAVATKVAQAHLDRRASRYIEATGMCLGNPHIKAGTTLKMEKVGTRFSGKYTVTSATHLYTAGTYMTEFAVSSALSASLASLMLPEEDGHGSVGPVVGVVTNNKDPDGMGRVKVKLPWLSDTDETFWARVVSPGAGNGRGLQFLPEVNDEVLVDFDHGDINYPYVLGGMWNGHDAAVKKNEEAVDSAGVKLRYIKTRAGHVIMLDDTEEAGGITIQDKAGEKIFLDNATGKGGITIQDKLGNKIILDVQGKSITIEALQDLTMKANGQVQIQGMTVAIKAQTSVDIEGSGGPVSVKGLTTTIEGQTATMVKSNVNVSIQGTAMVQIQGALVKLN